MVNIKNIYLVTNFAKKSNDLKPLSVPDISILALSFELVKENNLEEFIRKEPMQIDIVESTNQNINNSSKKIDENDSQKKEINPQIVDLPESQITQLDSIDDFPDLTKESSSFFSNSFKILFKKLHKKIDKLSRRFYQINFLSVCFMCFLSCQ